MTFTDHITAYVFLLYPFDTSFKKIFKAVQEIYDMLWTDRRTETDNTTTLVATRLNYDPISKVNVQQQMLGLACVSVPVKLCFLSIQACECGSREVSVSLNTHSLYRVHSDPSYLCEYQVALS